MIDLLLLGGGSRSPGMMLGTLVMMSNFANRAMLTLPGDAERSPVQA
jgi:hypothetical protein